MNEHAAVGFTWTTTAGKPQHAAVTDVLAMATKRLMVAVVSTTGEGVRSAWDELERCEQVAKIWWATGHCSASRRNSWRGVIRYAVES